MADDLVSIRIRLSGGKEAVGELRMVKGEMASLAPTTSRAASRSTRSLDRMKRGWAGLKKIAKVGALGIAAGVGLLATQIKPAISATEELASTTTALNQNLGMSVRQASAWAAVGISRGLDSAKMATGFKALSSQVEAARGGSKTATEAFDRLGISQEMLQRGSRDVNGLLFQVSRGMDDLGAGTARTAIGSKLFGRSWAALSPVLREGSGSLREQLDLANQYGATFGGKSLKSVQDLAGAQRELKLAQLGLQIAFTTKVAPALMDGVLAIAKFVRQMRRGKGAGGQFANIMRVVVGVLKVVWKVIKWVWRALRWLGEKFRDTAKRAWIAMNGIAFGAREMAGRVTQAVGWIKNAWHNFIGFFSAIPGRLASAGRGMWNFVKNGFRSAVNWVIRGWNSLEFKIPGFDPPGPGPKFGGITIGTPDIPTLAAGGVGVRAGWSIVGEEGPEMRWMPRGAEVRPIQGARNLPGRGGRSARMLPITLKLDGRVLAQTTVQIQEDEEARR